jgi:hypothetical protein
LKEGALTISIQADVIGILQKCTQRLTEFQKHLGKLVEFFSNLNNMIDTIHETKAKEFLAQVNNIMVIETENQHERDDVRLAQKKYLADVSTSV